MAHERQSQTRRQPASYSLDQSCPAYIHLKADPSLEFIYLNPWSTKSNIIPNVNLGGRQSTSSKQVRHITSFPKEKKLFSLCLHMCACLFLGPPATKTIEA